MPERIGGLLHPGNMVRRGQPFAGGKRGLPSRLSLSRARPCGPVWRSAGLAGCFPSFPFCRRWPRRPMSRRARPGGRLRSLPASRGFPRAFRRGQERPPPAVPAWIHHSGLPPRTGDGLGRAGTNCTIHFSALGDFIGGLCPVEDACRIFPCSSEKARWERRREKGKPSRASSDRMAAAGRVRCDDGSCGHRQQGGGPSLPPGQAAESVSTPRRAAARTGGCRPAACARPGRPVP